MATFEQHQDRRKQHLRNADGCVKPNKKSLDVIVNPKMAIMDKETPSCADTFTSSLSDETASTLTTSVGSNDKDSRDECVQILPSHKKYRTRNSLQNDDDVGVNPHLHSQTLKSLMFLLESREAIEDLCRLMENHNITNKLNNPIRPTRKETSPVHRKRSSSLTSRSRRVHNDPHTSTPFSFARSNSFSSSKSNMDKRALPPLPPLPLSSTKKRVKRTKQRTTVDSVPKKAHKKQVKYSTEAEKDALFHRLSTQDTIASSRMKSSPLRLRLTPYEQTKRSGWSSITKRHSLKKFEKHETFAEGCKSALFRRFEGRTQMYR